MSEQITITLPAINPALIASIEQESVSVAASEVDAFAAIRAAYAPLARHAGYVRIGWEYRGDGSNWREERDHHYRRDGKIIHAILCDDSFDKTHDSQWTGRRTGTQLWLIETGEWLRIERDGNWSAYQGASEYWACGWDVPSFSEDESECEGGNSGSVRVIDDAEVARLYHLDAVLAELGKSLSTMAAKLPERLTRIRQRAELAAKLIAALA